MKLSDIFIDYDIKYNLNNNLKIFGGGSFDSNNSHKMYLSRNNDGIITPIFEPQNTSSNFIIKYRVRTNVGTLAIQQAYTSNNNGTPSSTNYNSIIRITGTGDRIVEGAKAFTLNEGTSYTQFVLLFNHSGYVSDTYIELLEATLLEYLPTNSSGSLEASDIDYYTNAYDAVSAALTKAYKNVSYSDIINSSNTALSYTLRASGNGVTLDDSTNTATLNTTFTGINTSTNDFYYTILKIDYDLTFNCKSARILLYFRRTGGNGFDIINGTAYYNTVKTINNSNYSEEDTTFSTSGSITYSLSDENAAAYKEAGMKLFSVCIQGILDTGTEATLTINDLKIYQYNADELELINSKYYDDNFINMTKNIFNALDSEDDTTEEETIPYSRIVDSQSAKVNYFTDYTASGSIVSADYDTGTVVINTANTGLKTNHIQYEGDDILYRITMDVTYTAKSLQIHIFGYDTMSINEGWKVYTNLHTYSSSNNDEKTINVDLTFDPANFSVYQGKDIFGLSIQCQGINETTGQDTIAISNLSITKVFPYESMQYYDADFLTMMNKMNNAIVQNTSNISSLGSGSSNNVLYNPLGNKYDLRVNASGGLIAIPHIPNKIIFIGNSFLLGQTFYGMCATEPTKDWYYLTMLAIKEKNSSVIDYRCHGAWFEQLGTEKDLDTYWNNQKVRFVGATENTTLYWNDIFQSDIDCVIIQLGDNADGTDDRLEAYIANLDSFAQKITTKCPNARLVWLGSSARIEHTREITEYVVNKYGMGYIDIYSMRSEFSDFNGVAGQTYLTTEGTYETTPTAWLSHPGDGGHKHIADAVIEWLDL